MFQGQAPGRRGRRAGGQAMPVTAALRRGGSRKFARLFLDEGIDPDAQGLLALVGHGGDHIGVLAALARRRAGAGVDPRQGAFGDDAGAVVLPVAAAQQAFLRLVLQQADIEVVRALGHVGDHHLGRDARTAVQGAQLHVHLHVRGRFRLGGGLAAVLPQAAGREHQGRAQQERSTVQVFSRKTLAHGGPPGICYFQPSQAILDSHQNDNRISSLTSPVRSARIAWTTTQEKPMSLLAESVSGYLENASWIRRMFEAGGQLKARYGAENVYDFSLGNPNVPAPEAVKKAMIDILNEEDPIVLHGYTNSNAGYEDVRQAVADSLNERFGTSFAAKNITMTVGAAGGLNVILKALLNPGDEVVVFAPYFGEYRSYTNNYDGVIVEISPDTATFQPKLDEFREKLSPKTKAVIVNTPNNPTGVVYSEETIKKLAAIMEEKQKEFGTEIYLISDEPYRELAYDGVEVPYLTKYYDNTIVGYSYSKSLSLPGERIGYLVIPDEVCDSEKLNAAANVATRILGFVNAPTLQQKVVKACLNEQTDISYYDRNRETLYNGLKELGFECIKPEGAFYLFVKSPVADEKKFCNAAKKHNILLVPGSSFGCPGYVRMAYCVAYETIVNSLPKFKELAEEYK